MVTFSGLVSSAAGNSGGFSITSDQSQGLIKRPTQSGTSTNGSKKPETSRLQSIRRQHMAKGVSEKAAELLPAGWSKGTNKAYQSGWARWIRWSSEWEVDPVSCGIQPFLDFLADLYGEGLQYRSINSVRSAVSMTHNTIEGVPTGQHPLVSRMMRGIYNSRPPEPQYSTTWDAAAVLSWVKEQGENKDISLKELSGKLALLMALVRTNRTSELHALDLRFRSYTPEGVQFKLASLAKKTKVGAPLKECFFCILP